MTGSEERRRWRRKLRRETLTHYGGGVAACVRCGVDDIDVLVLDHINDDGYLLRPNRGVYGGTEMYCVLRRADWPPGYQTLCANCNMKKMMVRMRVRQEETV